VIPPLKVALIESTRLFSPEAGAVPDIAHVRHPAFPILQVAINVLHSYAIVVPRICLLVFCLSLIFCLLGRSLRRVSAL
jgi:hypothetical protein